MGLVLGRDGGTGVGRSARLWVTLMDEAEGNPSPFMPPRTPPSNRHQSPPLPLCLCVCLSLRLSLFPSPLFTTWSSLYVCVFLPLPSRVCLDGTTHGLQWALSSPAPPLAGLPDQAKNSPSACPFFPLISTSGLTALCSQ